MLDLKERTRAKFQQLTRRKGDTLEEVVLAHGRRPRHEAPPAFHNEEVVLAHGRHRPQRSRHEAPPHNEEEAVTRRVSPPTLLPPDPKPHPKSSRQSRRKSGDDERVKSDSSLSSVEEVTVPRKLPPSPTTHSRETRQVSRPKTPPQELPQVESSSSSSEEKSTTHHRKLPRSHTKSSEGPRRLSRPKSSFQSRSGPKPEEATATCSKSFEEAILHEKQTSSTQALKHLAESLDPRQREGKEPSPSSEEAPIPLPRRIPRSATFIRRSEDLAVSQPLPRSETRIRQASVPAKRSRLPRVIRRGDTFTKPNVEDEKDPEDATPPPHPASRTLRRRGTFTKFAEIEEGNESILYRKSSPRPQKDLAMPVKKSPQLSLSQDLDVEPTKEVVEKREPLHARLERRRRRRKDFDDQLRRQIEGLSEKNRDLLTDEWQSSHRERFTLEASEEDEEEKEPRSEPPSTKAKKELAASKSRLDSSRSKISKRLDNLKERLSNLKAEAFKTSSNKEIARKKSSCPSAKESAESSSQTSDQESSLRRDSSNEDKKETKKKARVKVREEPRIANAPNSEKRKKSKKPCKKEKAPGTESLEEYCEERKRDKAEKRRKKKRAQRKKAMEKLRDLIDDPLLDEGMVGIDVHKTDLLWTVPVIQPQVRVHIVSLDDGASLMEEGSEKIFTTQPSKPEPTLRCEWEEILFIPLQFKRILLEDVVILFHLVDQPCSAGADDFFMIAWAFLKIRPQPTVLNVHQLCRLQLYMPPPQGELDVRDNLEMICHLGKCQKYPSSLYVTVRSVVMPPRQSLIKTAEMKEDAEDTEDADAPPASEWGRLPGQACKVPNILHLTLRPPSLRIMALKFSWSGRKLAVSYEATVAHHIAVYSFPQGNLETSFKAQEGLIYCLDWSFPDDAKLLSASADGTVAVWLTDGWRLQTCLPHPAYVYCAKFNPRHPEWVVSGSFDQTLRAWRLLGCRFEDYELVQEASNHTGSVNDLCWATSGTVLYTADSQGRILVWNCCSMTDPENARKRLALILDRSVNIRLLARVPISSISLVCPGTRLLVNARNGTLCLVDIKRELVFKEFQGSSHLQCLLRACVSPCGNFVFCGGEDGTLRGWCMVTGQALEVPEARFRGALTAVDFHPLDHALAAASVERYGPVLVWRAVPQPPPPCADEPSDNIRLMRVVKQLESMLRLSSGASQRHEVSTTPCSNPTS